MSVVISRYIMRYQRGPGGTGDIATGRIGRHSGNQPDRLHSIRCGTLQPAPQEYSCTPAAPLLPLVESGIFK